MTVQMMKRITCIGDGGMAAPVIILDVPDLALQEAVAEGSIEDWFLAMTEFVTQQITAEGADIRKCVWNCVEIEDTEANSDV